MKRLVFFIALITIVSSCGERKVSRKNAAADLFAKFESRPKRAPQGQNPQMVRDFQTYLAGKYQDTTVIYYDIYDMAVGDLNQDGNLDFAMQYSAPTEDDCLQCWVIYHTYFVYENKHYAMKIEERVGEGSGGNGNYIHIDNIQKGIISRSHIRIEEGDDMPAQQTDSRYYQEGKLLEAPATTTI